MRNRSRTRNALYAKIAVGAVVVLALLLTARIAGKLAAAPQAPAPPAAPEAPRVPRTPAPPAVVPPPGPVDPAALPTPPCWSCRSGERPERLEIGVDLDLLAPLGTGGGNAAAWFHDFIKIGGPRLPEYAAARKRLVPVTLRGRQWKVLPADDPLLLEAESWVDQPECRFYPELIGFDGFRTEVPNLLLAIQFARSWVARGDASQDREQAREDYRRAVRIGRLYLQDDLTMIQDLVGLACVRYGLEGLFDEARRDGDTATMAAAGLALGDVNAIRLLMAERITATQDVYRRLEYGWFGPSLDVPDDVVEQVLGLARSDPSRPLRIEAVQAVWVIARAGSGKQQEKAAALLEELAEDGDPYVAEMTRWLLDWKLDRVTWEMLFGRTD